MGIDVVAADHNHDTQSEKNISKWCHGFLLIKSIPHMAKMADDISPSSSRLVTLSGLAAPMLKPTIDDAANVPSNLAMSSICFSLNFIAEF